MAVNTEAAAEALAAAIRTIFAVEPIRTGNGRASGTAERGESAQISLAVPPEAHNTIDIIARMQLSQKLRRLINRVTALRKTNDVTVLIDPGDGQAIPLDQASRETIIGALEAVERRRTR